jgi:hypothetical protein
MPGTREHTLDRSPGQALQSKTPADDHRLDLGGTAETIRLPDAGKSASFRPASPADGT